MYGLYQTILYQPILNFLVFVYNVIPSHDIGLAIIVLTFVVKLILLPFSAQGIKSQKALQEIQPKMEELKIKYKGEKEKLAAETMKLYKEQKVNPLSSCLPLLIQFPFLIAVYQAFRTGLASTDLTLLYSFVANPGSINPISLGFIDLAKSNLVLAVLAGIAQYIQTKMLSTKKPPKITKDSKDEGMLAGMNKSMNYLMPLMTMVIGASLPGGLTLYWLVTTILTIVQQKLLFKTGKNPVGIIPPPAVTPSKP